MKPNKFEAPNVNEEEFVASLVTTFEGIDSKTEKQENDNPDPRDCKTTFA